MDGSVSRKPNTPEQVPEAADITPETQRELKSLKEQIEANGIVDGIFEHINALVESAGEKVQQFLEEIPLIGAFFKDKNNQSNQKGREVVSKKYDKISPHNLKALQKLDMNPDEIPFYESYKDIPPKTIGFILKDNFHVPVWADPNPEQKTGGSNTVMVPLSIFAYYVQLGFDPKGSEVLHKFARKQLTSVKLPSTFRGGKKHLMVNPLIKPHIDKAFRLMEKYNVKYNLESAGVMVWRGGRGNKMESKPSYVPIVGNHGFGTAIDFNAANNPYAVGATNDFPKGFIRAMKEAGFDHGGDWKVPDQMHFEIKYQNLLV